MESARDGRPHRAKPAELLSRRAQRGGEERSEEW